MDSDILAENAAECRRLQNLASRLSDADLRRDAGGGWTVAVALAHLAFWDRLYLRVLENWATRGMPQDDPTPDPEILNDALLGEWRCLSPKRAADLAVAAAQTIDAALEALGVPAADAILAHGQEYLLRRGRHRREHLDQIERLIRA